MDTSDGVGAQLPGRDRPAQADWQPNAGLFPLEEEMVTSAAAGELVDRGAGPFDPAEMPSWRQGRTIRSVVLRYLLTAGQWPVHAKGVRLRGVRIIGCLDLEAAALRCPLLMDGCYLDADEPVCLNQATAPVVSLTSCVLAGLNGEQLTAKALDLSGSTLNGPLKLRNGDIAGDVRCSGAYLEGSDEGGNGLIADGINVGGRVLLDGGFTAAGAVRLPGADIAGELACSGAHLTGHDRDGNALVASRMKTGGDVLLNEGFTADGAVRLVGAVVSGQLVCRGGHLNGRENERGCALLASGMKIGSDVVLDRGFTTASGGVRLVGAEISGRLSCRGAHLTGRDVNGNALHGEGMKVGGPVLLDEEFAASGAVCLLGADISGQLSCRGAHLTGRDDDGNSLHADGMKVGGDVFLDEDVCAADGKFTAVGAVCLAGADIAGRLNCCGAQLEGADRDGNALIADGMKTGGDVLLGSGFTAAGAVRLPGAEITGQLICSGARLTGTDRLGNALAADRMKTSDVFFDEGFTAAGAIRLAAAELTGQLTCRGTQLNGADRRGRAMFADGMKTGGHAFLEGGFTAAGAVRLQGAEITGNLSLRSAQLNGADEDGNALVADRVNAGSDLFLDEGFTAAGTVSLVSARVTGSAHLAPARLACGDQTRALDATRARIAGRLTWAPSGPVRGQVHLDGATVGELEDDWSGGRDNGYWPTGGLLRLNGFAYTGFGASQQQATVAQRLAWISSQYQVATQDKPREFATQPYEQLAGVYRQAGQDTQARKVAIARRADLRKYGKLNWYRWVGNWLLDKTIRYGYQAWRAGVGLAALFVAVWMLAVLAQHLHVIVPVGNIEGLRHVPSATECTSSYPCFYPAGYAVDTVIPIINVHQAAYWGPDGHAPWGWAWVSGTWLATGLGWALATLLVAGYTGLVRQD